MTDLSRGACAGKADQSYAVADVFYPEPGKGRPTKDPYQEAKEICARCTIREICLQDALTDTVQWGYRAGLTAEQRQSLKRQRQRATPTQNPRPSFTERFQMWEAGWSDTRIAAAQGVTAKTIKAWRNTNGYKSNHINHRVHTPEQNALKAKLWEAGYTDCDIAAAVPCKPDAIRKWRIKTGRKANPMRERISA